MEQYHIVHSIVHVCPTAGNHLVIIISVATDLKKILAVEKKLEILCHLAVCIWYISHLWLLLMNNSYLKSLICQCFPNVLSLICQCFPNLRNLSSWVSHKFVLEVSSTHHHWSWKVGLLEVTKWLQPGYGVEAVAVEVVSEALKLQGLSALGVGSTAKMGWTFDSP